MSKETLGSAIGTSISAIGTGMQSNELLQTISLVITILGGIITILMALTKWWKDAKKDGKITKEELKEGGKIVKDNIEDLLDDLTKEDKEDKR
jgi:flagellar motor component MotA